MRSSGWDADEAADYSFEDNPSFSRRFAQRVSDYLSESRIGLRVYNWQNGIDYLLENFCCQDSDIDFDDY